MLRLRDKLAMHHWTRLGQCPACMRTACLFALSSFASATVLMLAGLNGPLLLLVWITAAAFAALWFGHVFMFSLNATRAMAVSGLGVVAIDLGRRSALLTFLKILFVAATVTSIPKSLRAQSCNCYSDSDCYCPPDFPQCVFNPSTGEAICCGAGTVGCAGPTLTWCCPPGSQCYGTDAQCMANQ